MKVTSLARTAVRRWFLDRQAEFWLGELRAGWSISDPCARVVEVIDETTGIDAAKTFVLATPRTWPGHRAGQYVPVEVEIAGVRVRRCYSISSGASLPGSQRIAITVKRVPGGRVSTWMHERLGVGAIVRFGAPAGDFVVDEPRKLLLVGGGSGITPIIAIVRDLVAREALDGVESELVGTATADVIVVHAARTDADAIFGGELAALGESVPGLRVLAHRGPLDAEALRRYAPDHAAREVYACGPHGLVEIVTSVAGERVRVERFVAPVGPARPTRDTDARRVVRLAQLDVTHEIGEGTLLEELERAGQRPAHGCRMGICNTCRCTKRSGTVEDALTGAISSEPDQEIRLCVSIARSDLELAL